MAEAAPFTLRWGILATGHVAERFVRDLLTSPLSRGVYGIRHQLAAVASSRSLHTAINFCATAQAPVGVKTYGSYAELIGDSDIDIVYIATPVSHHFQNAMMAIDAGKAVLCEKALTVTASQARTLVTAARKKRVFLLEALWTRFFPLCAKVRDLVASGVIGTAYRVIADTSINLEISGSPGDLHEDHRLLKRDIGGGAMLDLGIYSLTWIMQILYHLQREEDKERPVVVSAVNAYPTGVDEMASFILNFRRQKAMGIGMTSLRIASGVDYDFTAGPTVRIQGSSGEIQVFGPAFKPKRYCVIRKDGNGEIETEECPIPKDKHRDDWGHGLFWEADECARCIKDGKLESEIMPLDESVLIVEIIESILNSGGIRYPDAITSHRM
ncbi:Hypothetical protein R9X50_00645300 [Acrodontium crateriforme]|uniref:D-xylose 1-dehydrogenase (NADP(+), D-xylono-1,5-lactone-forming) n=1 Tax=Acrodontium crateriforme TaxID=150365 RepID=A0AAQ3RBK5_9PEZI|nr:Hypothetical protein R9X50_00645300 [Acrodontium crateriforme]